MCNIEDKYILLFSNQAIDTKIEYKCIRETKMYLFLEQVTKMPIHIFRVHKNTLNIKGIKLDGKNGYMFNVPKAMFLKKIN